MAGRHTYNTIVISPEPRGGRFVGGIIDGTPLPGTVMQIKAATEKSNGLFTFQVFTRGADGERPQGPIAVLCEDNLQGKTVDDAYVTGTYGLIYIPTNGDELLMRVANIAGTDALAIGDLMIVDTTTGHLIDTTGTPESEPFMIAETISEVWTAATLVHCFYTGY